MERARRVADAVFALSTDYPRVANCPLWVYLIQGTPALLIDAGVASTYQATLAAALAEVGVRPEQIGLLLITHGHPDHLGGAHAVKSATGAEVGAPLDEVGWVESFERQWREYWLDLAGGYPIERDRGQLEQFAGPPVVVERALRDGDQLSVGGRQLRVVQTRGHTRGHCSYLDLESGALFTGDAVQGDGVPSSDGTSRFAPMYADVDDYLQSLHRLADLDFEVLCPAHAAPLRGAAAREFLEKSMRFAEETAPRRLDAMVAGAGREGLRLREVAVDFGRLAGTEPPLSPQSTMTALAHLRKRALDRGEEFALVGAARASSTEEGGLAAPTRARAGDGGMVDQGPGRLERWEVVD